MRFVQRRKRAAREPMWPPSSPEPPEPAPLRSWWLPCALVLCAYLFFLAGAPPGKNPNEFSRIALSVALADSGSIHLDSLADVEGYGLSQDRSVRDGRTYSDKAPGLSFVAVPAVFLLKMFLPTAPQSELPAYWPLRHIVTGVIVALPAALLLFLALRRYPATPGNRQVSLALLFALTTPLLTYATVFFSHVPAAVLVTAAFVVILRPGRPDHVPSPPAAALGGVLMGYAVATEYPTIVAGLVLALALLLGRPPWRVVLGFAAGGLVGVLPVLVYHHVAFGAAWTTGYSFKADVGHTAVHAQGLMGVMLPTLDRLWGILFSARRGVVYYCPLLLLVPAGYIVMVVRKRARTWPLVLLSLAYVGFAAGFVDWQGGWCAAARHLTPVLPLLVFPVAEVIDRMATRLWSRLVIVTLAGMSASSAVLSVAVTPFFPENFTVPLAQVAMRCLRDGAVAPNVLSEVLSIPPVVSLVVFAVIVFTLAAVALTRMLPSPLGKFWIPLVLPLAAALHLAAVGASAGATSPQDEAMRAVVLYRIGRTELAERLWAEGMEARPGARPAE